MPIAVVGLMVGPNRRCAQRTHAALRGSIAHHETALSNDGGAALLRTGQAASA